MINWLRGEGCLAGMARRVITSVLVVFGIYAAVVLGAYVSTPKATPATDQRDKITDPFNMPAADVVRILNRQGYRFMWDSGEHAYFQDFPGGVLVIDPHGQKNSKVELVGVVVSLSSVEFLGDALPTLLKDLKFSLSFANELRSFMAKVSSLNIRQTGERVGGYFVLHNVDSELWVIMIGR